MSATTTILRRWMAMDRGLSTLGLELGVFAKQFDVSEKTVRRDLEAFRELGKEMMCDCDRPGRRYGQYTWFYASGVDPLFTCNTPRRREPAHHRAP
jgi:hypothetical protein